MLHKIFEAETYKSNVQLQVLCGLVYPSNKGEMIEWGIYIQYTENVKKRKRGYFENIHKTNFERI